MWHCALLSPESWGSESGPCAGTVGTLPTEPSPSPSFFVFVSYLKAQRKLTKQTTTKHYINRNNFIIQKLFKIIFVKVRFSLQGWEGTRKGSLHASIQTLGQGILLYRQESDPVEGVSNSKKPARQCSLDGVFLRI